jgi:hypothetical protein
MRGASGVLKKEHDSLFEERMYRIDSFEINELVIGMAIALSWRGWRGGKDSRRGHPREQPF